MRRIRRGAAASVYLILGDDAATRSSVTDALVALVDEQLAIFNIERVYGENDDAETTAGRVLDAVRTLPMLGERRIVLVSQADKLLRKAPPPDEEGQGANTPPPPTASKGKKGGGRGRAPTESAVEALESYLAKPFPHAVLAFVEHAVNGQVRFVKRLLAHAVVVECTGLGGATSADQFVRAAARDAGAEIDRDAARLLVERAGADHARLRADVDKVLTFSADAARVTADAVRAVTSEAGADEDNFAVPNAIERRDAARALKELALRIEAGESPHLMLGQLRWFVTAKLTPRVSAGAARTAIDALFRTDRDLKTSVGDSRVLLERLVVELCGLGR